MEQRVSLITLGVADLPRARAFYEQLGWKGQEVEETVATHVSHLFTKLAVTSRSAATAYAYDHDLVQ